MFSEEPITFHLQGSPGVRRADWALAVEGAVVARGEANLASGPAPIAVTMPKLREGIVGEGSLTAESGANRAAKRLWVFAPDPWHGQKQTLEAMHIRVFDRDGTTADALEKSGLPFKRVLGSTEGLLGTTNFVTILPEGLSIAERKGLARAAMDSARNGGRVLWLAPKEGVMPLPGAEEEATTPAPSAVSLRRADIVHELDKRLSAQDWRSGQAAMASLQLTAAKRRVECEWRGDADGWPWLDVRWPGGGRLIMCGFDVIGAWDKGPAPRYLLAAMVEELRK